MLMCSQWCTPFFCGTVTKWLLASTSCLFNSLALLCLKPIGFIPNETASQILLFEMLFSIF